METFESNDAVLHSSALDHINNNELDIILTRFGSFLTIIQTKKISPASLLIYMVENPNIVDIILDISGLETFEQLVREMMERFPILYESKVISTKITKINANRKTKRNL